MTTQFNFGAKTTVTPAFGTGSITFGTPATQTLPTGSMQFGSTTAASSAPTLLGTTNTPTATPFGTNPAPAFGQPAGGGLFGAVPTSVTPSLSFGAPAASGTGTNWNTFGTMTTAAPSLAFGAPASTSAPAATGMTFASAPAGLTFGAPVATTAAPTGLTFGTPATTASAAGLTFGGPVSSAPTTGLSFGLPQATTTVGTGGLFGPASTPGASLGLGGFGTTTATSAGGLSFSLGGTPATTTTLTTGLGGTNTLSATTGLSGIAQPKTAVTTVKEAPPKEQVLPNEILQTVDQFKQFVKQQKLFSSDIIRCNSQNYWKIDQEINALNNKLTEVEGHLQRNKQSSDHLKFQTANLLSTVDLAQRTHDTPPGLQHENTAPLKFFMDLTNHFENEMQRIKMKIEDADKYVRNFKNPDSVTNQDLILGIRRLHETFVALAGRLQSVHSQVESQKEMYMNLRKQICNDTSNPFPSDSSNDINTVNLKKALTYSPPKVATGPTPFSNMPFGNLNPSLQQGTTPPAAQSNLGQQSFSASLFGSSLGNQPSASLFGGGTPLGQSTFQLQKPPSGTKRKV